MIKGDKMFNSKKIILAASILCSLSAILISSVIIYKHYNKNIEMDQKEQSKNTEQMQSLIKVVEKLSISQRLFLKKMETCFNEGNAVEGYKNCSGLAEQFMLSHTSIVAVSEATQSQCPASLQSNIQSYDMIIQNYRLSNSHFLLEKLRELEAHIKSKCEI